MAETTAGGRSQGPKAVDAAAVGGCNPEEVGYKEGCRKRERERVMMNGERERTREREKEEKGVLVRYLQCINVPTRHRRIRYPRKNIVIKGAV